MGQRNSKSKNSYQVSQDQRASSATTLRVEEATPKTNTNVNPTAAETTIAPPTPTPAPPTIDLNLVPKWLNETQFVEILAKQVPQFSKIQSFSVKPALGPGENYATLMLRVSIDVELKDKSTESLSYMMKVAHDNPELEKMMEMNNFFTTENKAYLDILPKIEDLYKAKGLDIQFAPRAYKLDASKEPKLANTVLMYDLGKDGYKNVNRLNCLNLEQAKFVLRKMAQYHAAGAKLVEVHGPYEKVFRSGAFADTPEVGLQIMEQMFGPMSKLFLDNMKSYKGGEKYYDSFVDYFSKFTREFGNLMESDPNEFNVLNHGDCWVNNLLFKLGPKQEIIDMIFVDFQSPKYGSPAQDLLYFIATSVHIDHKLKDFDLLIKYYHEQLREHLNLLDFTGRQPTLKELHMQLYKYGSWYVFATFVVLPVVLLDPHKSATLENFVSDNQAGADFKNLMYSNKRYCGYIEQMMPWIDNRGLLEVNLPTKAEEVIEQIETKTVTILDWLNVSDFSEIIASQEPAFDKIVNGTSSLATKPGDNYASKLLKVDIDVQLKDNSLKTHSFILKVQPDYVGFDMSPFNLFPKEIEVYGKYVPAFEALYKEAGSPVTFSAKSFRLNKDIKAEYLVLDNLQSRGFKMYDRMKGMDLEHAKCVLKKLAQWHAASLKYKELNGPYPAKYDSGIFNKQTVDIFKSMLGPSKVSFLREVSKFEGVEEFAHKLGPIFDAYVEAVISDSEIDENEFNVLNHGDAWINNIMFQYDDKGGIQETFLLDHQVTKYGHPAQDLYYFLLSSTHLDIKVAQFDYLIRWYHENLVEHVQLLKYSGFVPNLKELHIILLKHPVWGAGTVCSTLTICMNQVTEDFKADAIMTNTEESEAMRAQLYSNERYKAHFELIMPWLNRRGLLDFVNA